MPNVQIVATNQAMLGPRESTSPVLEPEVGGPCIAQIFGCSEHPYAGGKELLQWGASVLAIIDNCEIDTYVLTVQD